MDASVVPEKPVLEWFIVSERDDTVSPMDIGRPLVTVRAKAFPATIQMTAIAQLRGAIPRLVSVAVDGSSRTEPTPVRALEVNACAPEGSRTVRRATGPLDVVVARPGRISVIAFVDADEVARWPFEVVAREDRMRSDVLSDDAPFAAHLESLLADLVVSR
jgi:hypothetical protein